VRVEYGERVLPARQDAREDSLAYVALGESAQPVEKLIW